MFIPFISTRSTASKKSKSLERRRGGGGGGRGGGGGGGRGGGGPRGGGGGGGGGGRNNVPFGGGSSRPVSAYGNGGGSPITIPPGQSFAGRSAGGGTRTQVYGTSQYGSGYPGFTGRGIAGRPLPFFFWPVAFGGFGGGYAYYHQNEPDLGSPENSTRPGGPMASAFFISNSTNTTLRILADNFTVSELITDITTECGQYFGSNSSTSASPYLNDTAIPAFDQVVQYYRASTVALTLDGYNNTANYEPEGTPDTPLPNNIDTKLLSCMNDTIGAAVPLVDGAIGQYPIPTIGLFGLVGLVLSLSSLA